MSKPKVYLSGPMTGLNFEEANRWRLTAAELLRPDIAPVSPMRGKEYLQGKVLEFDYPDKILSNTRAIISRDYHDTTTADALLVNLKGADRISIGTVSEIAWAYAHRVPVVLVIEDGNPHVHPMVSEAAGWSTDDLEEACWVLRSILLPDPEPATTGSISISAAGDPFAAHLGPAVAFPAPQDEDLVRVRGYVRSKPKAS